MHSKKKRILIIMGRYLPGYKDGGPVRSIKNLVDYLGDEYEFSILTCDRDHGDNEPYPNIKVNQWNQVGNAQVFYVPPKGFTMRLIKSLSQQVDLIYLCGCFNDYAISTLFLKRLKLIRIPVIVASMGLFSPKAFRLKYYKKKMFIVICNIIGIFKNIYWSATSEMEIKEIREQVRIKDNFFIAEDLPRHVDLRDISSNKENKRLKIVWISRITPKKNLKYAIEILQEVTSNIEFTIYGPIHDNDYWKLCLLELELLPKNIKWIYRGNMDSELVVEALSEHDLFLFPTLGENYGHVIQEALSAGCITLLSQFTPWNDLEKNKAGGIIPLESKQLYVNKIEEFSNMEIDELNEYKVSAHNYAVQNSNEKIKNTAYRDMFDSIC